MKKKKKFCPEEAKTGEAGRGAMRISREVDLLKSWMESSTIIPGLTQAKEIWSRGEGMRRRHIRVKRKLEPVRRDEITTQKEDERI